jgi:hypothetical protein
MSSPHKPTAENDRLDTIAALRKKIAHLGPGLHRQQDPIPTGFAELDARIQGWPVPGLTEISGRLGSGRMQISLPSLGELSRHHRIAIVDPLGQLNPPGWAGVHLDRLLLIRPPLERAVWSAEQLARSGCFALVGLLDPPRLGRASARLARAAEHGTCALLIWTTESDVRTPAKLRIQIQNRHGVHPHGVHPQKGALLIRLAQSGESLWISASCASKPYHSDPQKP